MSASQALEVIRRHGSARDVQTALYYVTRGRTAMLLDLARTVQGARGQDTGPTTVPRAGSPTVVDVGRSDLLG